MQYYKDIYGDLFQFDYGTLESIHSINLPELLFFRSDTLEINSFINFCCCNINTINNDSAEKYSSLELAALSLHFPCIHIVSC